MSILLVNFLQNEPFLLCWKILLQQTVPRCLRRFPTIRVTPLALLTYPKLNVSLCAKEGAKMCCNLDLEFVIKGDNRTQSGVRCSLIQLSVLYLSRNKLSQDINWENFIPLQYTKLTYKATRNSSVQE